MKTKVVTIKSLFHLSLLSIILVGCSEESLTEKAQNIHRNVITLDTHDDINVRFFTDSLNYSQDTDTQINLPKMKAGGLDVCWLIVYTGQEK